MKNTKSANPAKIATDVTRPLSGMTWRILMVEDSEDDEILIARRLKQDGIDFSYRRVNDRGSFVGALADPAWNLVLADYNVPGFGAMAALEVLRRSGKKLPLIVVSGHVGEEAAAEVMRAGARDFVSKDKLSRLSPVLKRTMVELRAKKEAKEAQDSLKKSESKYQELYDRAPVAYHSLDIEGRIIRVNQTEADMLGYAKEEMIGRVIFDFIAEEQRPGARARFFMKLEGQALPKAEDRIYQKKDGTLINVSIDDVVERDTGGRTIAIHSTLFNVTARKQAEAALRQSEEKYRSLVESADDFIFMVGLDFRVISANNASSRLFDRDPELIQGKSISELFPPKTAEDYLSSLKEVLETGATISRESKIDFPKKTVWLSATISPVRDDLGRIIAATGISRDITEEKTLEERIYQAKKHYEQVIDAIDDAILAVDNNFRIASCNRAFASKTGLPIERVKGRKVDEVLSRYEMDELEDPNPGKILAEIRSLGSRTSGASVSFIEKYADRSGKDHYHVVSIYPVRHPDGDIYQHVVTIRDITEQKTAEENVRRLNEFNQRILDNVPVSIITLNKQGDITSNNEYALRMTASKKLVGRNIYGIEFFIRHGLDKDYRRLLAEGGLVSREACGTKDSEGKPKYLNIIAVPLHNERGEIEGALSMAKDDTEAVITRLGLESLNRDLTREIAIRKQAEETIRRLSEINQRILDNIPVSIVMLGLDGNIVAANQTAFRLMDSPDNPIIGQKLTDSLDIRRNRGLMSLYESLLAAGKAFHYENLTYDKEADGQTHSLNIIAVPILGPDGRVEGAISMALDNTEAMEAKERLNQLNRELERKVLERTKELNESNRRLAEMVEMRNKFLADASHELRTPLTVIQGNLDLAMLELDQESAAAMREYYGQISEEVGRMGTILSELTMLNMIDNGAEQLKYEPINLADLVDTVGKSLKVLADQKKIALIYKRSAKNVLVMGDESKLEKMLLNLVRNGIKYTNPRGRVRIWTEECAHEACLVVEDNGIGIPASDLPHIFERFYRVDKSRSRQEGGTGLGLAIARWIAASHGGSIEVESAEGKGSKFIVRLPYDSRAAKQQLKMI